MGYKTGLLGGKEFSVWPASPASQKADLRRPITAWRALVWAYADEIVLAASNLGGGDGRPGLAQSNVDRERVGGGTINGVYEPHADALLIHAKLTAWFGADGFGLAQVMAHAERRREMPASISLPRLRAVPVFDRNGNVLIERRRLPNRGRVLAEFCLLDYEGLDGAKAERREAHWRAAHGLLVAFLDVMPGFALSKWKVEGRGLTAVDESLTQGRMSCAVCPEG